jgi:hypothetical protein
MELRDQVVQMEQAVLRVQMVQMVQTDLQVQVVKMALQVLINIIQEQLQIIKQKELFQ